MAQSNSLSQFRRRGEDRDFNPVPSKAPKNGKHKASAVPAKCLGLVAIKPVVLTVKVALPAPFTGMSKEDGLTAQEGEDAEAGRTEQLRLTVSVNPFKVPIAMPATPWLPTGTVPSDVGVMVSVKSGCGGGAPLDKKM